MRFVKVKFEKLVTLGCIVHPRRFVLGASTLLQEAPKFVGSLQLSCGLVPQPCVKVWSTPSSRPHTGLSSSRGKRLKENRVSTTVRWSSLVAPHLSNEDVLPLWKELRELPRVFVSLGYLYTQTFTLSLIHISE